MVCCKGLLLIGPFFPRLAEMNIPRMMDALGTYYLYDG